MCQLQASLGEAGRPATFSIEPTQPTPTPGGDQERPREGRLQTEEITGRPAGLGEADRPNFAAYHAHLRMEATSTDPLAYKCRLGQISTSSIYK